MPTNEQTMSSIFFGNRKSAGVLTIALIFIIFPIPALLNSNTAFGAHPLSKPSGFALTSISTVPSSVHVGDNFAINATLFDYTGLTHTVWQSNGCVGALNPSFDKNVAIKPPTRLCPPQLFSNTTITILPASHRTFTAGAGGVAPSFKATSAGVTKVTLNLEYQNQTAQSPGTGFNHENATLIYCVDRNNTFSSPCSFKFEIKP